VQIEVTWLKTGLFQISISLSESRLWQSCLWQCTHLKTSFSLTHSFIYVVIMELFYNHLPFSFPSPLCMQIHPQHKSNRGAAIRYFTFMNSADHLFSFVQSSEGNPVQSCEGKALVKSLVQHGQANRPMPQPFFCRQHTAYIRDASAVLFPKEVKENNCILEASSLFVNGKMDLLTTPIPLC